MCVQVKHSYEAYKNLQQELVRAAWLIICIYKQLAIAIIASFVMYYQQLDTHSLSVGKWNHFEFVLNQIF